MDDFKVKHKFIKIALAVFLCFLVSFLFHTWNNFSRANISSDAFIESEYAAVDASIYLFFKDADEGVLYSELDEAKTSYAKSMLFSWEYVDESMQIREFEGEAFLNMLYCSGDRFFVTDSNVFLYRVFVQ